MAKLAQCKEGQFKLGDGQCGAGTPDVIASLDIDGDGYAGNGLSGRLMSLTINRGIDPELGRIVVGTGQYTLRNDDGRWSPRNSSSIYYPNIMPWRKVNTKRKDSGGTLHDQFTGYLREPSLNPDPNVQTATFDCIDLIERLRRVKISTPLYTAYRSDQLIAAILTLAGYTGSTSLETGSKTFPYASWRKASALDAIQQVIDSEMGIFFIGAAGLPTFHNRYHRALTTTADATLNGTMAGLTYRETADDIYNEAIVTCYPRNIGSQGELWRWQEVRLFAPGEVVVIEAEFTDSATGSPCEGSSVVTPVLTTDYTANALSNGTGTDKSSQLSVVFTAYGQHADLTLTNTGSDSLYVTLLKVRGIPITVPNPVSVRQVNQTSIDLYDITSTISLDQPLETSTDAARDAATYLAQLYGDTLDRIVLALKPADNSRIDAMATLDLNDRLAVTETDSGLTAEGFFINQINIQMGDNPISQVITYEATQAVELDLIILDSLTQTFDDLLGY